MLPQLPVEVLDNIIALGDPFELPNLAFVNKPFEELVRPYLYKSIGVRDKLYKDCYNDEEILKRRVRGYRDYGELSPESFHLFLRTIIRTPERGNLVKSMRCLIDGGDETLRSLTAQERSIIQRCLSYIDFPLKEQMMRAFMDRSILRDAIFAFLLLSFTALREVWIFFYENYSDDPPKLLSIAMFQHLIQPQQPLKHFKSLQLFHFCHRPHQIDADFILDSGNLLWLSCLPNIKKIEVCVVDRDEPIHRLPIASAPSLHTLSLRYSNVNLDALGELLSAASNLKRFEYHFQGTLTRENGPRNILDCCRLRDILDVRASTLEHLSLSTDWEFKYVDLDPWNNTVYGISGSLGNMNSFSRLTSLSAPLIMLLEWNRPATETLVDILPSNLGSFSCVNDTSGSRAFPWSCEDMIEQLVLYINCRKDTLRKFIARKGSLSAWEESVIKAVEEACITAGILFWADWYSILGLESTPFVPGHPET
ncbi:MAG: hypothetical protein Q9170_004875 [Blastenia crenularia]